MRWQVCFRAARAGLTARAAEAVLPVLPAARAACRYMRHMKERLAALHTMAALLCVLMLAVQPGALAQALPAKAANKHRIITLAPSATELVYAAGAGDAVVGTVLASDWPEQARTITRIGDGINYSDEAIIALHPTLVVGWYPTPASQALAARLEKLQVPLIYANPASLDEIPAIIRQLGRRLDTNDVAGPLAHALEARIKALQPVAPPAPKVFIEVGIEPMYTLGRDPLTSDMLRRCGGFNPYADSRVAAPQISLESVLHTDPDIIIVSPYEVHAVPERRQWWSDRGLRAAREGRIIAINPDWLHRPGPRLIDAAEGLCNSMHQLLDTSPDTESLHGMAAPH